jgi:hypothetical protein
MVLAGYFMFTQVYFHKTRVAYDVHLREALREMLPARHFPNPVGTNLKSYLSWDDWKVMGLLSSKRGGPHGDRLRTRNHYRRVYYTPEVASKKDLELLDDVKSTLGRLLRAEETASRNWYKTGLTDIPIVDDHNPKDVEPLSKRSSVVRGLRANNQVFLYVEPEKFELAESRVRKVATNAGSK